MKPIMSIVLLLSITALVLAAQSHKYACHNESCKSYKQVFTFEGSPVERKCPTCGKTLTKLD